MTDSSTSSALGASTTVLAPPFFIRAGESPLIQGDGWARMVIFEGRFEDFTVTPGDAPYQWTVTAPNGVAYDVQDVPRLKFDDKAIHSDLTSIYESEDGQTHAFLSHGSGGLALVRSLLGATAAADPALLGQVTAYVNAQDLPSVLARLDADGTLASLAGGTDIDTLLAFAYRNLTGQSPDADALAALRTEVNATLDSWKDTPATPADVLNALLLGPSVAQFFANEPGTFSYDWFAGPLLGTDAGDQFSAPLDGGTLDLGAGVDSVGFDPSYIPNADSLERASDGALTVQGDQGSTWTLHHVERVIFGFDKRLAFDLEGDGAAGQAARLIGVALGAGAVDNQLLAGEVLQQVDSVGARALVQSLVEDGVFAQLAGGDSLEALLGLLYRNVTGAAPSQDTMDWTLAWLDAQDGDATDAILYAVELPQTAELIGLPDLVAHGWSYGLRFGSIAWTVE